MLLQSALKTTVTVSLFFQIMQSPEVSKKFPTLPVDVKEFLLSIWWCIAIPCVFSARSTIIYHPQPWPGLRRWELGGDGKIQCAQNGPAISLVHFSDPMTSVMYVIRLYSPALQSINCDLDGLHFAALQSPEPPVTTYYLRRSIVCFEVSLSELGTRPSRKHVPWFQTGAELGKRKIWTSEGELHEASSSLHQQEVKRKEEFCTLLRQKNPFTLRKNWERTAYDEKAI